MAGSPHEAIAYVKPEAPTAAAAIAVDERDAPVVRKLGGGLVVAYVVDTGTMFMYIQRRDLVDAGMDADQLHTRAVANLDRLAEKHGVTIKQAGPVWALFCEGNFEASLILLDDLWESALGEYHAGSPVIALPSRDVLCFCDASSPEGIAELKAVIQRVRPTEDHLISDQLYHRQDGRWVPYSG